MNCNRVKLKRFRKVSYTAPYKRKQEEQVVVNLGVQKIFRKKIHRRLLRILLKI